MKLVYKDCDSSIAKVVVPGQLYFCRGAIASCIFTKTEQVNTVNKLDPECG